MGGPTVYERWQGENIFLCFVRQSAIVIAIQETRSWPSASKFHTLEIYQTNSYIKSVKGPSSRIANAPKNQHTLTMEPVFINPQQLHCK